MIRYFQLILIVLGLVAADVVRAQNLVDSEQPFLPGVWAGKATWGDYDNDGDLDLALIGEIAEECRRIAQILRNDEDVLFEDATQTQQLVGAYYGDLAWGDYDNDGDLDLVIVGWNVQDEESLNLYRNDEDGQPTDRVLGLDRSQTAFKGVRYATVDWGDYDNDGDLDLIVSGMEENGTSLTQLYRNGGASGWLLELDEVNSEALVNVHGGDLAWADYDGDGDLDLLVSGENVTTSGGLGPVTEFYLNSPTGTLNLDETLAAANLLKGGSAAWGDYDGDGNIDLAVSGRIGAWTPTVDLYRNRPAGVLTQDESFTLSATRQIDGQLAWVDYDNDGDADLAAVGSSRFSDYQAFVFDNREGSLSSVSAEDGLQGLAGGAAAWGDYDDDGKVDLLLIGVDESGQRHGILYNNQGTPNVNNQPAAPAQLNSARVTSNNVTFSWVPATDQETETPTYNIRVGTEEGGNDILSGQIAAGPGNAAFKTSKVLQRALAPDTYHWSVQTVDGTLARSEWSQEDLLVIQQFVSSDQRLRAFKRTEMAWGDVDDDGDFDLALMGENRSGEAQTLFYENAGGVLVVDAEAEIVGLLNGAVAWGDYDNDGDLDLAISGEDERGNRASRLYRTDLGIANLTFILVGSFTDVSSSALDWGDVDNDGDLDLVLMGLSDDSISGILQSYTRLFINDGQSGFVQSTTEPVGVNNGEAVWGDYDNDGDLDLALTGSDSQGGRNLSIYANDGSGQLADADLGLEPLESSDLAWGDYDRDGDLDLAAGGISSAGVSTVVYQNNDGQMEALAGAELPGIRGGDLVWADYDNDQDLDLAITGNDGQQPFLQLYENVDASFQQDPILILQGVDFSTVALVDIDGDADLDLISAGSDAAFAPLTVVNDNLEAQFNPNRAPDVPTTPTAQDSAATVTLSWGASADDGAPPPESLTYNVRLGTSAGAGDVVSGNAPLGLGNIGHRRFHRLGGLPSGTYFWSVQAIDQGFVRSDWTTSAQFTIDTVAPQVAAFNVNRQQVGIGQTVIVSINFADEHSGVNAEVAPVVEATIGDQTLPFELLQFNGQSWSGELAIAADTPSGAAAVAVRGLVDGKNNTMVPFDSVAVFLVDTEIPQIIASEPVMEAVDVASGTAELSITFSEPIAAVTSDDFTLRLGNTELGHLTDPVYDEGSRTVRLFPEGGLLPGARYTVEVSAAVQDLAGNRPDNAITWTFSTQVPQLVQTTPTIGATEVAIDDGRLSAVFDAPIWTAALSFEEAVQVVSEGVVQTLRDAPQFDVESNTLNFELSDGFRPGARYEVTLSSLLAGPLRAQEGEGDFRWEFQTVIPQLVRRSPEGSGAADEDIEAEFSAALDASLVSTETVQVTRDGSAETLDAGSLVFDAQTNVLSFELEQGLKPGARYEVLLSGLLAGPLRAVGEGDFRWEFQTPVPQLDSTVPTAGGAEIGTADATLIAVFDNPIDATLLTADNVQVLQGGESVAVAAIEYNDESRTARFAVQDGLRAGTNYQVVIAGAVGGALRQGDYSWTFITAIPRLVEVTPDSGAVAVAIDLPEATVQFSTEIDADQVVVGNFVLLRDGEAVILRDGDPVNRGGGLYSLAPAAGWQVGSTYAVQVSPSVTGPLGASQAISWQFRTAVPAAVELSPASGDTQVSTANATIGIVFDHPIDETALRQAGNVRALRSGEEVELTDIVYDAGTGTVSFTIEEGLKAGTGYQLGLSSALGGPLQQSDYSWSFSTAVPQLEEVTPVDGSSGVDIGLTEAVVDFSVAIDADQAVVDNFVLLQDGLAVALRDNDPEDRGTGQYGLAPAAGWQVGSTYTVQISPSVTGPLGTDQPISWKFSTAVPEAVEFTPAAGDVAVASSAATVSIVFDNAIDDLALRAAGNVQLLEEGRALELSDPAYDPDDNTVTFAPVGGLRAGTGYQVLLSSALGGPLQQSDYSWSFSTLVPTVVSTAPAADASLSSGPQRIQVTFSGPVDEDLITPQNFRLGSGGETIELAAGEFTYDAASFTVSYPSIDLLAGSAYEAIVSSRISGPLGADLPDLQWSFSTQIPQVVSQFPAAGDITVSTAEAAVRITFDSAIDEVALRTAGNVQLLQEGRVLELGEGDPAYNPDDNTVTFAPVSGLRAGTGYQVFVASALGGPLQQSDYSWVFSTLVPTVVSTTPAADAAINSGSQRIQVVFSSAVDEDLRTPQNFRLSRGGQAVELADEFTYDAASFTVSYPNINLLSGSAYEATVSSRLSGPLGADLADLQWSFATEVPQVVSTLPADEEDGVSTNSSTIQITFSQPVASESAELFRILARDLTPRPASAAADTVVGLLPPTALEVTGFGADSTGTVISFAPVGGLQPFFEYEIIVDEDVLGDLAEEGHSFTFRTAGELANINEGGTLSDPDGKVELYFPPNALSEGGEVRIRRVSIDTGTGKRAAQEDLTPIGLGYEIDAGGATLRKPATLIMRYSAEELGASDSGRLGVFSLVDGVWQRVGGTVEAEELEVRTSVEEFGTYALFEDRSTPVGDLAVGGLDCQPRSFDPSGGGIKSETDISFTLSGPTDVTVRVYNASGRLERVIVRDQPMAPGRVALQWDGRDEDQGVVASGLYIVVVNAGGSQQDKVVAVVR